MTIIGLCFGAGEIGLGLAAGAAALVTLRMVKWAEAKIPQRRRAMLQIKADPSPPAEIDDLIRSSGYQATFHKLSRGECDVETFEVSWISSRESGPPGDLVSLVEQSYEVISLEIVRDGGR